MSTSVNRTAWVRSFRQRALRHPVLTVFVAALAARLAVAIAIAIAHHGGGLLIDDESYARLAAQAADGGDARWSYYEHWLYERTGALLWPISGLFGVFGQVNLLGQAYVALLGAATAAFTAAIALEYLSVGYALLAGAIVALLPSQILWSSIILKDAVVWMSLSGLALVLVRLGRADRRQALALVAAGAVLLLALAYTRRQTLEIALIAMVIASLFAPRHVRLKQLAVATAVAVLLPMAFQMGPAGITLVTHSGSLENRREKNALGADSAIVTGYPDFSSDFSGTRLSVSYIPSGLAVMALRPYPWEAARAGSSMSLRLAGVETVIWYPLLILAAVGLFAARRVLRALAFPLLVLGATAVMYGLVEGSLGTAYRHRGEFVWAVALLAATGAAEMLCRRRRTLEGRTGAPCPQT